MRLVSILIVLLGCLGLPGCGGGGGGDAPAAAAGAQALGTRAMPGGTLSVTTASTLQAGSPATFHLRMAGFSQAPSAAEARVGTSYDAAAAMVPGVAAGDGYDFSLTVPATAAVVWVRLTFPDGSVVESGADDFLVR